MNIVGETVLFLRNTLARRINSVKHIT